MPDLVLLDIDIPVMNGWEVAERLPQDEATRKLKIVGVSAGAGRESFQRAESPGFEACQATPFAPAELPAVARRLTGMDDGAEVSPDGSREG